jgi:hypothetical protein
LPCGNLAEAHSWQGDVVRSACTRRARLRHQLGLDRNRLRRPSDRIEALFLLVAFVAFIPLALVATILAASWTHSAGVAELRAGSTFRRVTAVLVQPAPAVPPTASAWLWAPARWVAYGRVHTGSVLAARGTRAGATVQIWVDRNGQAQSAPPTPGQVTARVVLVAAITPAAVALGLWLSTRALRRVLDRRRIAAWGRAWSVVGPLWTWHR